MNFYNMHKKHLNRIITLFSKKKFTFLRVNFLLKNRTVLKNVRLCFGFNGGKEFLKFFCCSGFPCAFMVCVTRN